MTETEYSQELKRLAEEYKKAVNNVKVKFAEANNPYKVGDIIKDHYATGRIKSCKPYNAFGEKTPSMVYICDNLTKKGTINKREPEVTIYQANIKSST